MRFFLFCILLSLTLSNCATLSYDKEISGLENSSIEYREATLNRLMKKHKASPVMEDTIAYITYMGPKLQMAVAGDFNGWDPNQGKMTHVKGTDFWYLPLVLDPAANVQYKLVSNNQDWFVDPKNTLIASSDTDNSVLQMPKYKPETETKYIEGIPHGQICEYNLKSKHLNAERNFKIYYPSGYALSTDKYPLVLVNDGYAYLKYAHMANVLDQLINEDKIPPVVAVFLPPDKRTEEYAKELQGPFKSFVIEELYPWLKTNSRLSAAEGSAVVLGSSYGGTISLSLALEAPEIFGNVGAFSGYVSDDILQRFSITDKTPIRIYLNHGIYDHLIPIQESLAKFKPILVNKGYEYRYEEYPEAHHYEFWRAHLDDALIYLIGKK